MKSFLLGASAAVFGAWGLGLVVMGCATVNQQEVVCTQSLKKLWQATSIYQQDHGENGDLLGFPPLSVAVDMVEEMFDDPCEEEPWHRFFAKMPYMYLPREQRTIYGEVLAPSFRERREAEGDYAVIWACLNHNDDVPPLLDNYLYRTSEMNRGGTLMGKRQLGAWWIPHSRFWDRSKEYWLTVPREHWEDQDAPWWKSMPIKEKPR